MRTKNLFAAALLLSSAGGAWAQTLVCDGVLGNSGEAGNTLVRFAGKEASGIGVVADKFGSLWDRAGLDALNRYAPDGRLLAQYRLPKGATGAGGQDKIALVGDLVVLKLDAGVYSLAVDAPTGTAPKNLNIKATRISANSHDGWLAAANDVDVFLFNPATGEKKPVSTLEVAPSFLEMGPDGAVYVATRGLVQKIGDDTDNWPKKVNGDRLQWLDGAWWGHAYHSTVFRYDGDFALAPGVVLGGGSGSFIGHLDENTEISNGRGLALARPGIYAVSGWNGVLHLLQWDAEAQRMDIVRRIGSVSNCSGIGLDRAGNVWWNAGSWKWGDQPDAPLQNGMTTDNISQAVMLPNDVMAVVGERNGKAAIFRGRLTTELDTEFVTPDWGRKTRYIAATTYLGLKNERFLLVLTASGQARELSINPEGAFRKDGGELTLQTATPVKAWTSLAMKDDKTLLGAADGNIIELARDGENWKESARWNSWGDQKFGSQIWISADANRLWVSDCENNRVLCFDPVSKNFLASFGLEKGDDLAHFDAPQSLTARGERAVVFDSGNQRLVKLRFQK